MKRYLEDKEMRAWVESVDGLVAAASLIKDRLGCSQSKADKIAGCRYPSTPQPLEQMAIAELMGRPRDAVYPLIKTKSKRAS